MNTASDSVRGGDVATTVWLGDPPLALARAEKSAARGSDTTVGDGTGAVEI